MRIAVWHNLPSGGGKRALYYHVKGLLDRGHTLEVWCPPTANPTYLPLGELCPEHVIPFEWRPSARRGPMGRALAPYQDVTSKLQAMDRHCQECAEEMHNGGFDLLFANSCLFFRASSIARHAELPSVLYLGEPYRWLYEALPQLPWLAIPPPRRFWWSPRYLRWFLKDLIRVQALRVQAREEWYSAQAFDAILVNSLFSRESVLRAYGLDAQVCYLGVDTKSFRDLQLPKGDYVVGVGHVAAQKNIGFVIEAVATLREPRPRLVWIGDGGSPRHLDELKQLAVSRDVCLEVRIGISDDELVETLCRAEMMLYAPRLEPFGFAPLEANACGLPVIAVAEGGIRETVVDGVNGLLVEHDPHAMAGAIERLRSDRCFATQLGQQGRDLARRQWSLEGAVDRLEAAFYRLVDQGKRVGDHQGISSGFWQKA